MAKGDRDRDRAGETTPVADMTAAEFIGWAQREEFRATWIARAREYVQTHSQLESELQDLTRQIAAGQEQLAAQRAQLASERAAADAAREAAAQTANSRLMTHQRELDHQIAEAVRQLAAIRAEIETEQRRHQTAKEDFANHVKHATGVKAETAAAIEILRAEQAALRERLSAATR